MMFFALFDFANATSTISQTATNILPDFQNLILLVAGVVLATVVVMILVRALTRHDG
jgi:hypothetical protein